MAHKEQVEFCNKVKDLFPNYFNNVKVLDVGSFDCNGNDREYLLIVIIQVLI